ncbi:MAG: peptide chain release factor N(5)-glutamine methyltransferase [Patescibacteria group bacterium]|nr:MAG: peptide chain release factor N(5)-glutamine methyltransferase [Patescibacteria group bacterium]
MHVRDLTSAAASRLKRARIPEPLLEAESLLARLLKKDLAWLLAHPEAPVSPATAKAYATGVAARARHVPFAQIIGERGFYGRVFTVTKDVLIPRPETELLVEAVLARTKDGETFLDIGTGSGAIGLTLAAERANNKAVLYDVSAKALAVAKTNARRLKLGRRVRFAKIDILKNRFQEPRGPVAIVANLPYLPIATWKHAQPEVRMHEPKLALVSGKDGLDHYRALFKHVARWKRPPKLLALEAEPGQFKELAQLAASAMPGASVTILKDLHRDERILIAEYQNAP